jgi:hypothetical protein
VTAATSVGAGERRDGTSGNRFSIGKRRQVNNVRVMPLGVSDELLVAVIN